MQIEDTKMLNDKKGAQKGRGSCPKMKRTSVKMEDDLGNCLWADKGVYHPSVKILAQESLDVDSWM